MKNPVGAVPFPFLPFRLRSSLRPTGRSPGPPGVSDGVVALGGMEWRECDEHERDVRRDMTAIYFHNLISVSWLEVHPVLSSSHLVHLLVSLHSFREPKAVRGE